MIFEFSFEYGLDVLHPFSDTFNVLLKLFIIFFVLFISLLKLLVHLPQFFVLSLKFFQPSLELQKFLLDLLDG